MDPCSFSDARAIVQQPCKRLASLIIQGLYRDGLDYLPDKGKGSPLTKTKYSLSRFSSREARTTPAGFASVPFLKKEILGATLNPNCE